MDVSVGSVVLGKMSGYSAWPAKVVAVDEAPPEAIRARGKVMVEFFSTKNFGHLERKDVKPFKYDGNKKGNLRVAMEEALIYMRGNPDRFGDLLQPEAPENLPNRVESGEIPQPEAPAPAATLPNRVESGDIPQPEAPAPAATLPKRVESDEIPHPRPPTQKPSTSSRDPNVSDSDSDTAFLAAIAMSSPTQRMRGRPPAVLPSESAKAAPRRRQSSSSSSDYVPSESGDRSDGDQLESDAGVAETAPEDTAGLPEGAQRRRKRRKIAAPDEWKKNKAKNARQSGKAYVNYKGQEKPAKAPAPVDCSKCRFRCQEKITEEERVRICGDYYSREGYQGKKDFLLMRMKTGKVKTRKTEDEAKQREGSYSYTFVGADGTQKRVCQNFFLKTLAMTSDSALRTARAQKGQQGEFAGTDKRGKQPSKNKTPDFEVEKVREHIRSFPVMDPHYSRKDSRRQYLAPGLNRTKMYELYLLWAPENGVKNKVGKQRYLQIFDKDFDLGFFQPKKDQCVTCGKQIELEKQAKSEKSDSSKSKEELASYTKDVYNPHRQRNSDAQDEKARDKANAKQDPEYASVTFDLQSVLYTPCSDVSVMYYKRKFCVYNLTVYEQQPPNDGYCFLWDECTGKRGSNEIASCIIRYLNSLPATVKRVSLYSDTCGGQNRNIFMSAALLHHVCSSPNLEIIDQKFLESGHTFMEVDSMHAAIEFAKKHQKVRVPFDWEYVIVGARSNKPYHVDFMTQENFFDMKSLAQATIQNRSKNTEGDKVNWQTTKWLRYDKSSPTSIFYKTNYTDTEFKEIAVAPAKATRGYMSPRDAVLKRAYLQRLPISAAKKSDLMSLFDKAIIEERYRDFYSNLPSNDSVSNRLPEPMEGETAEGEDGD